MIPMNSITEMVQKFNRMYKLPCPSLPTLRAVIVDDKEPTNSPSMALRARLVAFRETLAKELAEIEDIIELTDNVPENAYLPVLPYLPMVADLLGDLIIYCMSEMLKYGLNPEKILSIIMQSNFSKLQEDGSVLYDANGKVEKGPNYYTPEPELEADILDTIFKAYAMPEGHRYGTD